MKGLGRINMKIIIIYIIYFMCNDVHYTFALIYHYHISFEDALKHFQNSEFSWQGGSVVKDLIQTNNQLLLKTFNRRTKVEEMLLK